jgi:hypothetical protein
VGERYGYQSAKGRTLKFAGDLGHQLLLSELFGFWGTFGEAVECPCVAFGTG